MKKLLTILTVFGLFMSLGTMAQQKASPPAQTKATVDGVNVTIDYHQPALKGRPFGTSEFHPYGKVWRNGANNATTLELSADATINGETLAKGKYAFFVIPGESEWTLIFNSVADQWGAYDYDSAKDVMRVSAKSSKATDYSERYTISLDSDGNGSLNWGDFTVSFTVSK